MPDYTQWPTSDDVENLLKGAKLWPSDTASQTLATAEIEIALDAVVKEINRRTGWQPFLANSATTGIKEMIYDATSPLAVIDLGFGLVDTANIVPIVFTTRNAYNWRGGWLTGTVYAVNDSVLNGVPSSPYTCILAHTADASSDPGVGGSWQTYWQLITPTLTLNTNLWLRQSNATLDVWPYDQVQFVSTYYGSYPNYVPNLISIIGRIGFCTTIPADMWDAARKRAGALTAEASGLIAEGSLTGTTEDRFQQTFSPGLKPLQRVQNWNADFDRNIMAYMRVSV